jgi:propanol-preferring alcohol dehydrogenase
MRVALPWLGYACGDCGYCNSGRETLCGSQLDTGYSFDGAFAEYAVGYACHVVRVPDGIDPADAAPLTCARVTSSKAVKVSGAGSSGLVAVFGVGGLSHLAVSTRRSPVRRSSPSTSTARLETALALGVDHVINAREEDPVAAIQRLGDATQAIATAVSLRAFEQALGSLARGGTFRGPRTTKIAWDLLGHSTHVDDRSLATTHGRRPRDRGGQRRLRRLVVDGQWLDYRYAAACRSNSRPSAWQRHL